MSVQHAKGAISGLRNGTRMVCKILPPPLLKVVLKDVSASMPGASSPTTVTTRQILFFSAQVAIGAEFQATVMDARVI
jgi:hypothetical protein